MLHPLPLLARATVLSAALAWPAAARDAGDFDGTWTVEMVTESGPCGGRRSYQLGVRNGQIGPLAQAATDGATVTGRVGSDGAVALSVATAAASGAASGRLRGQSGTGTWTVSGLCAGRWTARRQTTRTAQAN